MKLRTIACTNCHKSKVRCIHDPENLSIPCKRCAKSQKKCVFSNSHVRKHSKQNQEIFKLQQQIESLQKDLSVLRQGSESENPDSSDVPDVPLVNPHDSQTKQDLLAELRRIKSVNFQQYYNVSQTFSCIGKQRDELLKVDYEAETDVVGSGLLTMAEVVERLSLYQRLMYSEFAFVSLGDAGWDMSPDGVSAGDDIASRVDSMRKKNPFLFITVLVVTSLFTSKDQQSKSMTNLRLGTKAAEILSHEVLIVGSKSIELLQCLLLMCFWYDSGELFQHRRYHLLNNLCVALAQDLGLDGKRAFYFTKKSLSLDVISLESNRMLALAIYSTQMSFSIFLRRDSALPWSPYLEESFVILSKSSDEKLRRFSLYAKLHFYLERALKVLHNTEFNSYDVNDPRSRYVISDLHSQLSSHKAHISPNDHSLWLIYYSVEAYIFEPPFHRTLFSENGAPAPISFSVHMISLISNCAKSCVNGLEHYMKLTPAEITSLPLISQTRMFYLCGMLTRLRYMSLLGSHHSELGILPESHLNCIKSALDMSLSVSEEFPCNYFLTKSRLVLTLALQTYNSEVCDALDSRFGMNNYRNASDSPSDMSSKSAYHKELWTPKMEVSNSNTNAPMDNGAEELRGHPSTAMMRVVDMVPNAPKVFPTNDHLHQNLNPNVNLLDFLLDNRTLDNVEDIGGYTELGDENYWANDNVWNDLLMGVDFDLRKT